jgi:hypothetical protein
MVVEGLLVVIHVARVRIEHEKLAAEFQQVVGRAGLVLSAAGKAADMPASSPVKATATVPNRIRGFFIFG